MPLINYYIRLKGGRMVALKSLNAVSVSPLRCKRIASTL